MDTIEPGSYIDQFKINEVLHSGAMGQIYKATDMLSDQTVCIKMPFGDILNHPVLYYHFQNEQRIGRLLNHSGVVGFLAQKRPAPYLLLEYIPGKDLRSAVPRDRKVSPEKALELTRQIAEGIVYLHNRGVIHLDIKPENIMVTPALQIKIIDFGLARILNRVDLLSEDFMEPQGTPFYISPEQLLGCRNDLRSDIYSLGMVFYELMTGKLPFKRSTRLSKVRIRLKANPIPPRHHDPNIPPQIQEIILRSLERDPDNRYQSAASLCKDLVNYDKITPIERGRTRRKQTSWRHKSHKTTPSRKMGEPKGEQTFLPQILGAIIDHDNSDQVVEMVKRQAIMRGYGVTLLTVIGEKDDSDFTRYQTAVDGERFLSRIDGYVGHLRNYNLDPLVRIKRGIIAEQIVNLAQAINADLIILGATRKKGLKKMFGGSTIDKIIKKAPCYVVVAEPTAVVEPLVADISDISSEQIFNFDLFLLDNWVYHLNWISDLTYSLLRDPKHLSQQDEHQCKLGEWIDQLKKNEQWENILAGIIEPHNKFHEVSRLMAEVVQLGNIDEMKRIYFEQALPLSIRIREGLQAASTTLREHVARRQAGLPPYADSGTGVLAGKMALSGTTQEKMRRIRDYFWRYPDGTPESCLLTIDPENGPKDQNGTSPEKG